MDKKEDSKKEKIKTIGAGIACIVVSTLAIAAETICLTKLKGRKR